MLGGLPSIRPLGAGGAFGFEASQIPTHVLESGRVFELSRLGPKAQVQGLAATLIDAQNQLFGSEFSDFRRFHVRSSP